MKKPIRLTSFRVSWLRLKKSIGLTSLSNFLAQAEKVPRTFSLPQIFLFFSSTSITKKGKKANFPV
ncbi:hypothetical protein AZJ69_05160 [Streptococcus pneumoniae]|nr:hypothetical protein AZK28_03290 [Streptococcus pneumoniae]TVV93168.1 hypothetical protein AZK17_06480 [Streptococcus pneumoniae]TVW43598.1 hypothetical protein AZJ88_11015 [Streptococcus pneumoniae]TVW75230.1 hypothetical protein AZJ69_05160 [Streptococcus pneumoniae]TVX12477.1 hypothetical protein AZJ55_07740 [Streptococcus pneumoniae]